MRRLMFCAALLATGCGGGGSSSVVPGPASPSSAPVVALPPQGVAELQLLQGTIDVIRLLPPNEPVTTTVQSSTLLRAVLGHRFLATAIAPVGACQSGYEYSQKNGSKAQESTVTLNSYYDDTCTTVENVTTIDQIGGAAAYSQVRTGDFYYTNGTQFAHQISQVQATVDVGAQILHTTINDTFATRAGSPELATLNAIGQQSATVSSYTAAYRHHTVSIGSDIGAVLTLTDTSSSSAGSTIGIPDTVSGTLSLYGTTINTLSLITNSTSFPDVLKVGDAKVTASYRLSVPYLAQYDYLPTALTVIDTTRDFTVHAGVYGSQLLGTIVHTSAPGVTLASFSMDLYGNGTATFSDGVNAQRSIMNRFIQ